MNHSMLFRFETDFANNLQCIPMIVRFKLDHIGIKLSLRQWSRFHVEERHKLVTMMCYTAEQIDDYKIYLTQLINERAKEDAVSIPIEIDVDWASIDAIPQRVIEHSFSLGLTPLDKNKWSALNHLQRFALCKLTRAGHDNDNFIPAMREFGLLMAP